MPGPNLLTNPDFTQGGTGWLLLNETEGGNQIEFANGMARLYRPTAGAAPSIRQSVLTIGAPYRFTIRVFAVNGSGLFGVTGGTQQNFSTPGTKVLEVPAAVQVGFIIIPNSNSQIWIDWASAQRSDQGMSKVVVTLRDYDGDKKQTSAELGPVVDGPSYVTREAQAAAIRDAVNAVAGNIAQYDFLAQSTEPNNINTATPVYQTHVRWIVELFDSVTGDGPYAFDIPTADLGNAALFLDSSVEHDPAAAEWIALKAAMNGIVVNPRTGSTMTVGRIYLEE